MTNKTVLVTGSTGGLGGAVVDALTTAGATVLAHGRDPRALDEMCERLTARYGQGRVHGYVADLADLREVIALAARIRRQHPRLDALVNNAAVGGGADPTRREVNAQGIELRLAVNHVAPFLLARELRSLLCASAPARVVNVASMGQLDIDFDDVELEHDYEGVRAYCRSKTAMIMGTFELAADLAGTGVTVNAVHPAHLMDTRTVRQSGMTPLTTVDEGAEPTVRLVTDPALETVTGRYFDQFTDTAALPQAYDSAAREQLAAWTARWINRLSAVR